MTPVKHHDMQGHMLCITAWATDPACKVDLCVWHVWSRRGIFNQRSGTAHNCLLPAAACEWDKHLIIIALITICGQWQLSPLSARFSVSQLWLVISRPLYLSWKCLFSVGWLQRCMWRSSTPALRLPNLLFNSAKLKHYDQSKKSPQAARHRPDVNT